MSAQTLLGAAGGLNLTIEQGSRYVLAFTFPVGTHPLTGYSVARMQARSPKSAGTTLFDWSTVTGELTIDTGTNQVLVDVSAVDTAALAFNTAKYDFELVPVSGEPDAERWFEGTVTLSHEATR